ncbi:MAG: hypothetical protein HY908_25995 [Myxococcales bacterium]|nr:hypothetical protein [Myxococcales bacterium]
MRRCAARPIAAFARFGLGAVGLLGCPSDPCLGNDDMTPAHLEACELACERGNASACDRRSQVERGLGQLCSRSHSAVACRALCQAKHSDPGACAALKSMP